MKKGYTPIYIHPWSKIIIGMKIGWV